MRLNVVLSADKFRENFTNVNLAETKTLELPCDDAEARTIILDNVLQILPFPKLKDGLGAIVRKLRIGGELVIMGMEVTDVCRLYHIGHIDLAKLNEMLYGSHNSNCTNLDFMVELVAGYGLKVMKKQINDNQYLLVGVRP